jgi:Lipase (class 3)
MMLATRRAPIHLPKRPFVGPSGTQRYSRRASSSLPSAASTTSPTDSASKESLHAESEPLLFARQRRLRQDHGARKLSPLVLSGSVLGAGAFYYKSREVRQWRSENINHLPLARDVWADHFPRRAADSVVPIVERCGLMGRTKSVKTDLERIRAWHVANGYAGGLVLRDLSLPAFYDVAATQDDDDDDDDDEAPEGAESTVSPQALAAERSNGGPPSGMSPSNQSAPSYLSMTMQDFLTDPARLARRECYYLYYEVTGDGQQKQQIFCRGTTIFMDVLTCLEAWMSYDPELHCRLHRGFCKQADRILEDVVPLLASPKDRRGTVEVCGHSLGGAVATIVAAKLRKRGYRVVRVTTAGSPRFCATEADAERLRTLLPPDYLRVEQEYDFVPFLPPFGAHVGDKLWLLGDGRGARFALKRSHDWSDSSWCNFLAWEIFRWGGRSHRVPSYTTILRTSLTEASRE